MKAEKILITGADGFLGGYITDYLRKNNVEVETLGIQTTNNLVYDLTKPIPNFKVSYDMVVHCAGKAHIIPKNTSEAKQFFDINYKGTQNLCFALENCKPKAFIFISTIAVYGLDSGENIKESVPLLGNTPYAKSKIKAEEFLQSWCEKNEVNLVILRLPLLAGANPKGNLESMIRGIKKGYYFNIAGNNAKKSVVLAADVASLIPSLIDKNGIYNLSGDKDYTFQEISAIISRQLNHKRVLTLPLVMVRGAAVIGDVLPLPVNSGKLKKMMATLTISSEKAVKELNWKPQSLEEKFKI
ncbi:MAG: UDP-galactose-4-epimerase [Flavobacteriales bacterium]|nr:MAG: UDP-galactose-4-epimerase [Flavobacteriales bacterium]